MFEGYIGRYLQTYVWKALSVVVSVGAFFVVVPFLSKNPHLYGIYTFCASFQLYLSYADIGFLSAGQKYAAEAYARADRREEAGVLGFVGAVLVMMVLPFSVFVLAMALRPGWILPDLAPEDGRVVSSLFVTMAVAAPLQIVLQRLTQSILVIRVKEYVASRVDIIGNLLKISSVFIFFSGERYLVSEYFLFINLVSIVCSLVVILLIRKSESYDFLALLCSFRLTKRYFNLLRRLSASSLLLTVSWVLCYELDLIFIGKLFSVEVVALYAVCLTLLNMIRQLLNIVYSPFSQRFNHFVALGEKDKLSGMLSRLIRYTCPLCLFVCSSLCVASPYLIRLWVGNKFEASVPLFATLSWFFLLHFISVPGSYICLATERYRLLNLQAVAMPASFCVSYVVLSLSGGGVISFAIAKLVMASVCAVVAGSAVRNHVNLRECMRGVPLEVLLIGCWAIMLGGACSYLFPTPVKSSLNLLILLGVMGVGGLMVGLAIALSDRSIRGVLFNWLRR